MNQISQDDEDVHAEKEINWDQEVSITEVVKELEKLEDLLESMDMGEGKIVLTQEHFFDSLVNMDKESLTDFSTTIAHVPSISSPTTIIHEPSTNSTTTIVHEISTDL